MDPIEKLVGKKILVENSKTISEAGGYHGEDLYRWNRTWVLDGFFFWPIKKGDNNNGGVFHHEL